MAKNLLFGKNIQLRALEPGDLDLLYTIENSTDTWRVGNTLIPYSRHHLEQYILSSQHDLFAEKQLRLMIDLLVTHEERQTVGIIDLYDFEPQHHHAGIGIFLLPEQQGKGYATEALEVFIRYCFNVLKLHMIYCNITSDNLPSINLFEKAGFTKCALKKEWRKIDDRWMDELTYQLIKP